MNTRALARKAIKEQIAISAFELFQQHGYEKTTVEMIAHAVGMSKRSYFRYFPTKEDVLLDSIHLFKSRFLDRFKELLASEDIWEALKHALIEFAVNCAEPGSGEVQSLIRKTPALLARQLEIIEILLEETTELYLTERNVDTTFDKQTVNAVIRSGFACLQSAQSGVSVKVSEKVFSDLMSAMKPRVLINSSPSPV
ncbi:TetR family transcriptional regulator [Pectobacterium brasiliense]|uniref:TetR/AcrR family transcriptional regulator n=1 Tax=Pectobacterium brasiliense TaxID=180957 RepID=UPI00196941AB|nr:TetR/AcrR family transcriptional regulator [Pectobacterium brasiliense]MBN3044177.1 TetR family transcriptional regulator [Pectobacterium brasiliense]MDG0805287.1 TetR/AcrR family transcriptional regulator [Pectobacterium brasiliense]